jgi:hypothetical protein
MNHDTETPRRNLKNIMDLLSDGHTEVTQQASYANSALLTSETRKNDNSLRIKAAARYLERAEEELLEQAARCERVRLEIIQIRNNLKVS